MSDLARWDHAKWLEDRLGEARAENAALTTECERLRAALTEACDWLDADLAHAPDTPTAMADRELVASWRAALGETDEVMRCPECGEPLQLGHDCLALGEADDE